MIAALPETCDGRDSGRRPHRWSTCGHVRSRGIDGTSERLCTPYRAEVRKVCTSRYFFAPVKQRIVKRQAFEFKEASSAGNSHKHLPLRDCTSKAAARLTVRPGKPTVVVEVVTTFSSFQVS